MAELLSLGLDVGTTTTQLILSKLTVENRAGAFSVPELDITGRNICYRSPVHFTPMLDEHRVDAEGLRKLVAQEYEAAGISPRQVDTGAIIITGETSRKENARQAPTWRVSWLPRAPGRWNRAGNSPCFTWTLGVAHPIWLCWRMARWCVPVA